MQISRIIFFYVSEFGQSDGANPKLKDINHQITFYFSTMEDLKSAPKLSNEKHRSVEDTMLNVLRPLEENTKDLSIAVKANQRLIKSKIITSVKNPPLLEAS